MDGKGTKIFTIIIKGSIFWDIYVICIFARLPVLDIEVRTLTYEQSTISHKVKYDVYLLCISINFIRATIFTVRKWDFLNELCEISYGMRNNAVNLLAMTPLIFIPSQGMSTIFGSNNLRQFAVASLLLHMTKN